MVVRQFHLLGPPDLSGLKYKCLDSSECHPSDWSSVTRLRASGRISKINTIMYSPASLAGREGPANYTKLNHRTVQIAFNLSVADFISLYRLMPDENSQRNNAPYRGHLRAAQNYPRLASNDTDHNTHKMLQF